MDREETINIRPGSRCRWFLCYTFSSMLRLLVIVLGTGLFWRPSVAKDQQASTKTATENTQESQQVVPPTSTSVNPSAATKHSESVPSSSEQDPPEKPLPPFERPEWVIVYVTAAYSLISGLMLIAIKRQADHMERQTGILERSVKAAEESVAVARENMGLLIGKERARVRVEVQELSLKPAPDGFPFDEVEYRIELHGSTPAFIKETVAYAYISNSDIPEYSAINPPMRLPAVITPAHSSITERCLVFSMWAGTVQITDIFALKAFIHFHGFIRYDDVFEREHKTTFRYVWKVAKTKSGSMITYWVKCGKPEDNSET